MSSALNETHRVVVTNEFYPQRRHNKLTSPMSFVLQGDVQSVVAYGFLPQRRHNKLTLPMSFALKGDV
jgi:hypothetical protein